MSNVFQKSMEKLRGKLNEKRNNHYDQNDYNVIQDFSDISNLSIESLSNASEKLTDQECKQAIKKVLYSKSANTQMIDFIYQNEKFNSNLDEEDKCYMILKIDKIRDLDSNNNNIMDSDVDSHSNSLFKEGGIYEHLNENKEFIEKCKKLEDLTSEDLIINNELLIRDLNYWKLNLQEQLIKLNYDRMNIIDSAKAKILPRLFQKDENIDNSLPLKYKEDTIWGSKIYKKDENNNRIPILEISFFRAEVRMPNMPNFDDPEENKKVYDTMALAARSKGIVKPVINVAEQTREDRDTFVEETIKSLISVGDYKIEDIRVPDDCLHIKNKFLENNQGLSEENDTLETNTKLENIEGTSPINQENTSSTENELNGKGDFTEDANKHRDAIGASALEPQKVQEDTTKHDSDNDNNKKVSQDVDNSLEKLKETPKSNQNEDSVDIPDFNELVSVAVDNQLETPKVDQEEISFGESEYTVDVPDFDELKSETVDNKSENPKEDQKENSNKATQVILSDLTDEDFSDFFDDSHQKLVEDSIKKEVTNKKEDTTKPKVENKSKSKTHKMK